LLDLAARLSDDEVDAWPCVLISFGSMGSMGLLNDPFILLSNLLTSCRRLHLRAVVTASSFRTVKGKKISTQPKTDDSNAPGLDDGVGDDNVDDDQVIWLPDECTKLLQTEVDARRVLVLDQVRSFFASSIHILSSTASSSTLDMSSFINPPHHASWCLTCGCCRVSLL
jgi:hypothetical protein